MKHKYIIFYEYMNGKGHIDYTGNKIKSSNDLNNIEEYIKKNTNEQVIVTDYKKVGIKWN
jgi:hypothetical protein